MRQGVGAVKRKQSLMNHQQEVNERKIFFPNLIIRFVAIKEFYSYKTTWVAQLNESLMKKTNEKLMSMNEFKQTEKQINLKLRLHCFLIVCLFLP